MRLSRFNNLVSIGKHTFKNNFGLSIAYWAALLIFPLRSLASLNTFQDNYATPQEIDYYKYMSSYTIDSLAVTALALLFSTIVGFRAFSYLHNKRKTDFYGSLPITRTAHLLGAAASLTVMTVGPIIISTFISMMTAGFFNTVGELSQVLGIQILAVLGNITMIALLSVVSGKMADVVVSFIMLNFGVPIITLLLNFFAGQLPGNDGVAFFNPSLGEMVINLPLITALSPLFAPYTVNKLPFVQGMYVPSLPTAPHTMFYVIWWSVISVAMLLFAVYLVKKRKAESAQSGFAYIQAREMIKCISSVAGGMLGGLFVAAIVGSEMSTDNFAIWFMFGCLLFSFLMEIILQLIYNKGFKEIGKFFINWGVSALIAIGSFVLIMSGMFGYVTRVPKTNDIKEVEIYYSDNYDNYYLTYSIDNAKPSMTLDSKEYIEKAAALHKEFIDYAGKNSDIFYRSSYSADSDDYEAIGYFCFNYKLKDGSSLTRYYGNFGYSYKQSENWRYLKNIPTQEKLKKVDDLDKACIFIFKPGSDLNNAYAFWGDDYYSSQAEKYSQKPDRAAVADGKIQPLYEALNKDLKSVGVLDSTPEKEDTMIRVQCWTEEGFVTELFFDESYTETTKFLSSVDNLNDRNISMARKYWDEVDDEYPVEDTYDDGFIGYIEKNVEGAE